MADVVEGVARDRAAARHTLGVAVEGGRHFQFDALRPHRVVVVGAIQAQRVIPLALAVGVRAHHVGGHHHRFEAEVADGMLQLRDGLLGRVHGDQRHRCHAVGKLPVDLGVVGVHRAAQGAPQVFIGQMRKAERGRGIEHREIDAHLVQARMQQRGEGCGCTVQGVLPRHAPPCRADGAGACALGFAHAVPGIGAQGLEAFNQLRTTLGLDEIEQRRPELQRMAIRVDDRMVELRADLRGAAGRCRHGRPPEFPRCSLAGCAVAAPGRHFAHRAVGFPSRIANEHQSFRGMQDHEKNGRHLRCQ